MATSILHNIGDGASRGTNLAMLARMEDSVRAGRASCAIGLCQGAQAHITTTHVVSALEASRVVEIPSNVAMLVVRCVLIAIPFFLALAIQQGIDNDVVRNICLFIQDHIGDLCQIASLVSSVALIVFGNIALGAASLTFIVLGALDRNGCFPEKVSYCFRKASMPIMIVSSLLTGGVAEKIFAVINLAAIGYEQYVKCRDRDQIVDFEYREARLKEQQELFLQAHPELQNSATALHSGLLTPVTLQQVLNGQALKVNPLHLKAPINAKASEATRLDTLLTLFDAVEWDAGNSQGLRTKLLEDDRFRQTKGVKTEDDLRRKGISDQDLVRYARLQLEQFINQIGARRIKAGAIHEYDRLENYLKIIIEQLPLLGDARDRASYIARLAVEGGQYCGPGRFHAVEEIWAFLVWKKKEVPLSTKVLFHLQDVRTDKLREVYQFFVGHMVQNNNCFIRFLKYVLNPSDLHTYNQLINLYGDDFGIRKGAADNDELAFIEPLQRLAVQRLIGQLRQAFFNFYTEGFVVEKVQTKIGDKRLPGPDVLMWWQQWLIKHDLVDTFVEEGTVYKKKLELSDRPLNDTSFNETSINPLFIKAMLFDMGILEFDIT